MKKLINIIPDRLTELLAKGEVTPRYYNAGDVFDEVHIIMINDDKPDPAEVKAMVGRADVFLHNIPIPYGRFFHKTLGWQPQLMRSWATAAVELAREIKPDLVRSYDNQHNAYLASEIKRVLGVPYIISMHANWDADYRMKTSWKTDFKKRLLLSFHRHLERYNFKHCDCVISVYKHILPYLDALGAKRVESIYNPINGKHIVEKTDYSLSDPVRLIVPGRQHPEKDATPLLHAVKDIPKTELTLIGQGPKHEYLVNLAKELGIADRCVFLKGMPNKKLCQTMHEWDVLVSVNNYGGVSKVELEASFVGMPVVTNDHPLEEEPEILGANCMVVDGDAASYRNALEALIADESLRRRLGEELRASVQFLDPDVMEARIVDLYKQIMKPFGA